LVRFRKAAQALLDDGLWWLRETYAEHGFVVERDLVWTLQRHLVRQASDEGLPVRVFSDHGVEPGKRRHLSADIALLEADDPVPLVAVEFKFEPSPRRADVDRRKLPVTDWASAALDVERIRRWVGGGLARSGMALYFDEGGIVQGRRGPADGGAWESWGTYGRGDVDVWVHKFALDGPRAAGEPPEDVWTLDNIDISTDPTWRVSYREGDADVLVQDMDGLMQHFLQAGATDLRAALDDFMQTDEAALMPDPIRAELRAAGVVPPPTSGGQ
jgi:hypothetical protein